MPTVKQDCLIIPDVHGRTFWREAVERHPELPVVFLGDYVDPYPEEGIMQSMAVDELREIIKFQSENSTRVTLLLGNHDMHYLSDDFRKLAEGSRFSYNWRSVLQPLFQEHQAVFRLAHETEWKGRRVLFTHAGVTQRWLNDHRDLIGVLSADSLNSLALSYKGIEALANIGPVRGGWDKAGGILWADVSEVEKGEPLDDYYQIFGHTQQRSGPVITPYYACLDCRRAFLLSEVMEAAR